ncbi:MAG: glucose-1-phosphate cytidylyltransferase [Candidatus Omnitrophota bacterium]
MKVVILCGGQGSRIKDVSDIIPKPMLPIGDKPMLWHIMKMYAHYGLKDFILCLGYKGWIIKEFFLNYYAKTSDLSLTLGTQNSLIYHSKNEETDWHVTLAETGEEANTGQRVWAIRNYLKDCEHFCFTYGDGVANVDINDLVKAHKRSGLLMTVTGVHPSGRFGEIKMKGNRICGFNEKPNVSAGLINGGFMVISRKAIEKYFGNGKQDLILESEIIPRIVKDGQVGIYKHGGFWQCVDTAREYHQLNQLWAKQKAPWKIW